MSLAGTENSDGMSRNTSWGGSSNTSWGGSSNTSWGGSSNTSWGGGRARALIASVALAFPLLAALPFAAGGHSSSSSQPGARASVSDTPVVPDGASLPQVG